MKSLYHEDFGIVDMVLVGMHITLSSLVILVKKALQFLWTECFLKSCKYSSRKTKTLTVEGLRNRSFIVKYYFTLGGALTKLASK